jgi:hypothetical protein
MIICNQANVVHTTPKDINESIKHVEGAIDIEKYPSQAVLECLMRFLNAPAVKNLSLERKCSFLRQKGLKENGAYSSAP